MKAYLLGGSTRIYQLQKKAIRILTKSKFNSHTEPLFKLNNLLKIEDIFHLNILKFYFNYCNHSLPEYFKSFNFTFRSDIHEHNTQNKEMLSTRRVLTKFAENNIRNYTPKLVNQTESSIINKIPTHNLQGFGNYIKKHYLNLYQIDCSIINCYICNRI